MLETRTIVCQQCQAELEVDEDYYREQAGQEVDCPQCGATVILGAEARPERSSLKLRKPDLPKPEHKENNCPDCGAVIAADSRQCEACGVDLQSEGIPAGERPVAAGSGRSRGRRLVVGGLAVLATIMAVSHMVWQQRQRQASEQTYLLSTAIAPARGAQNIKSALERLEKVLAESPRAHNRGEAKEVIAFLREELLEVPERTRILQSALEQAEAASQLRERIEILAPVMEHVRGAEGYSRADGLIREWRSELRVRTQLTAELDKARNAANPAEGVRILQEAIPRFGNAPNLHEAYELLAELQRRIEE